MIFIGDFANAFLQVLAIIGIIVVGGFVIFFLGDLVLSILDPNYVRFGHKKKADKEAEKEPIKQLEAPKEETKALEFKLDEPDEFAFTSEEPIIVDAPAAPQVEDAVVEKKEDNLTDLRAEEELFKANMLKAIEERRQKQAEEKDKGNEEFENFFFDDEDINVFDDENENIIEGQEEFVEPIQEAEEEVEKTAEEPAEEVIEEPAEEVAEEPKEDLDKAIEELKAQYAAEIARLQSEKDELAQKLEDANKPIEALPTSALSLEEYEERLETLKERLASNDKELRKVKKDFIPLRKVNKTLESDEKKLRRREALVAKQKVVLYGVNNMVDIDEEKAKKLAEDLDLLEGLRLSVQHCEEVMAANKDRYPILENTYNILSANSETLKADIEETEKAIANLKKDEE